MDSLLLPAREETPKQRLVILTSWFYTLIRTYSEGLRSSAERGCEMKSDVKIEEWAIFGVSQTPWHGKAKLRLLWNLENSRK